MSWMLRPGAPWKAWAATYVPAAEFITRRGSVLRARQVPRTLGTIRWYFTAHNPDPANTGLLGGVGAAGFCSGKGRIAGTVTVAGTPVARPVFLHHARSMRPVQSTRSAALDGAYEFRRIDEAQEYVVLARDDAGRLYNVTGADFVVPVLMD